MGYCGMTVVENFEVSSHQFSQPSLPFLSPFFGLALPYPSPSVPNLPTSAFQSQFSTKNRVISKKFSKKNDVGAFCLGSVGNPNHDVAMSQLDSLNLLSENFKSVKTKPSTPNLGTVSQGDAELPPMGGFQIEGLSPSKMAKVCEVLSSLDIKVYSRRKNRFATDI